MRTIGLFEAKQKLSEIVERASEGERIGITRRGKLQAIMIPAHSETDIKEIFDGIEEIRRRVKRNKKINIKELIEEGRM
ncbi:MAG TPA: type II toxin-antitoxin system prevent-host-death family antitoxin [Terriglobales bacterium]|jgi:prevent-host-death family protein|nr:type II toxin-antitoxin system prevent-host-death family antitoxin [Terriglobales bacterium]